MFNENTDINIIDYIKNVNKLDFNIDISFIDELLSYVNKNEICIPHELFVKYKVISSTSSSNNIVRLIEQHKLKENRYYKLPDVG